MKTRAAIAFPVVASAIGGAERVEYTARAAWVKLPGRAELVKLSRSSLPPLEKWSAFNLADAAQAELDKPSVGDPVRMKRALVLFAECDPEAGYWCHGAQWRAPIETLGAVTRIDGKRALIRANNVGVPFFGWIDLLELERATVEELAALVVIHSPRMRNDALENTAALNRGSS